MQADTPASYAAYLKQHPEGPKATLATARSAALIERNQWLVTIAKPTESGLSAFIRDNPHSIWVDEARAALEALADSEQSQPEPQSLDQQTSDHEAEPVPMPVAPQHEVKPASNSGPVKQNVAAVQIGAYKTRASAIAAMDLAKSQSVALRSSEPQIDIVTVKGQSLFRVRAWVSTLEVAKKSCQDIIRTGASCLVVKK